MKQLIDKTKLRKELSKLPSEMGFVRKRDVMQILNSQKCAQENNTTKEEMLDYLLSTGLYKAGTKKHPYMDLFYEEKMLDTNKTIPVKDLVERFIEIDREYNGLSWNIKQILTNIDMIIPVEDRE